MDHASSGTRAVPPLGMKISAACWVAGALVCGIVPMIVAASSAIAPVLPRSSGYLQGAVLMFLLVFTAGQLFLAVQLFGRKRGMARTILTVMAMLSVLGVVIGEVSVIAAAGLALTLVAAVLMHAPSADLYVTNARAGAGQHSGLSGSSRAALDS